MTHYTVMVIVPKEVGLHPDPLRDYLRAVLAPYDENTRVEEYIDVRRSDAPRLYDEEVAKLRGMATMPDRYRVEAVQRDLDKMLTMTAEEWFEDRYEGYPRDAEGNVTSTYNPKSKWDWWCVGGRWGDALTDRDGDGHDILRVGELDYAAAERARKESEGAWVSCMKEKRKIAAEAKRRGEKPDYSFLSFAYGYEEGMTRDDYINRSLTPFATHAVVTKDGEWHEASKMGWWAITYDETEDEATWRTKFKERFIDTADPEDILVVVDCHI